MSSLVLRTWTTAEWYASEAAWGRLLAQSGADPLFMSWEWQTSWWNAYASSLGSTPQILALYRDEELVGIAPFYRRPVVRGGVVPARSIQLMGLSWRDPRPLISEYLDVIARPADATPMREACLKALLAQGDWSELVIGLTSSGEEWLQAFAACAGVGRYYVRRLDRAVSYQADLRDGFDAYLRQLGQSTRRSLFNLRRRLAAHGEVSFEVVPENEITSGFGDLNRLHQQRWQRTAFPADRLAFHVALARSLVRRGELVLTRLRVAGQVVSVLYDIRKGRRQYNLKMGFDPNFGRNFSLGLLHLGYAMEAASQQQVAIYDFLAGPGQTTDFKRNLSQSACELSNVQFLRGPVLAHAYRAWDRLRGRPQPPAVTGP